jgi:DNA-binding protein HU-beta
MNRTELEATVVERRNINKDVVADVLDEVFAIISEELKNGNTVKISNFATLSVKDCAARIGKNPKTGEKVPVPERRKITIKAGKQLNTLINS